MAKATTKKVWRYQCDPLVGAEPMVQVYTKVVTTVDGEEFEKQSMQPLSVRMLDLFGPLELIDPERVERLAGAPASDRIVPLNHNQPEYVEAIESLNKLESAIATSNELNEGEREAASAEVAGIRDILNSSYVYARKLLIWGGSTLLTIAATTESDLIKTLASAASDRIVELAKMLLSLLSG